MDNNPSSMVIGRIAGAYGIKGWLKVTSFTDPHTNILSYAPWQLCGAQDGNIRRTAEPINGKPHGKGLVVQLEGIADRDAAEALRGLEIRVAREQLPETEEGQFYWADLEGLQVCLDDGTEIGHIDHLLDTGSADVMVITGSNVGNGRQLIPFIYGDTVTNVDLDAGRLVVDWDIEDDNTGNDEGDR